MEIDLWIGVEIDDIMNVKCKLIKGRREIQKRYNFFYIIMFGEFIWGERHCSQRVFFIGGK